MEKNYFKKDLNKRKSKPRESSSKRKIIVAIVLIIFAFSGSFLIYYILQVTLNTEVPMVVVVSGSMEPTLYKGDLLFLQGKDPTTIKNGTIDGKEGDIIVFDAHGLWLNPPPDPIVHRVVNKKYDNGWFFLTKGDANPSPDDAWVPDTKILGVVVGRIPYIGWVKIILTDSGLLIPLLVIVSALLVISIIWDIVKKDDNGREKKKRDSQYLFDQKYIEDNSVEEVDLDFTKND
jgi:signal peptidase